MSKKKLTSKEETVNAICRSIMKQLYKHVEADTLHEKDIIIMNVIVGLAVIFGISTLHCSHWGEYAEEFYNSLKLNLDENLKRKKENDFDNV